MFKAAGIFTVLVALAVPQSGTGNLLVNGDARRGAEGWKPQGVATVETYLGVPCFAIRDRASFSQEVVLTDSAAGKYAALVGKGQSDRINLDGSITGLPYLYALVGSEDRIRYLAYWQGQNMRARPTYATEWVPMSGVFKIPKGARYLHVQLGQAERKDLPQDGSVARFSDIRLHIFPTEEEARSFIKKYQ
jgi:hypothetical protein